MARRKVIRVRIKGKLMTLREVSEKYHISPELLRYRTPTSQILYRRKTSPLLNPHDHSLTVL